MLPLRGYEATNVVRENKSGSSSDSGGGRWYGTWFLEKPGVNSGLSKHPTKEVRFLP